MKEADKLKIIYLTSSSSELIQSNLLDSKLLRTDYQKFKIFKSLWVASHNLRFSESLEVTSSALSNLTILNHFIILSILLRFFFSLLILSYCIIMKDSLRLLLALV